MIPLFYGYTGGVGRQPWSRPCTARRRRLFGTLASSAPSRRQGHRRVFVAAARLQRGGRCPLQERRQQDVQHVLHVQ